MSTFAWNVDIDINEFKNKQNLFVERRKTATLLKSYEMHDFSWAGCHSHDVGEKDISKTRIREHR